MRGIPGFGLQIAHAPDGVGGGGEGTQEVSIFDDNPQSDVVSAFSELFGESAEEPAPAPAAPAAPVQPAAPTQSQEVGDEDDETEEQQRAAGQALATRIGEALNSFKFSEDIIPENFDPNDSRQLRELLAKTSRHSMLQTITIMMDPLKQMMEKNSRLMRKEMGSMMSQSSREADSKAILKAHVPEIDDPSLRPVVQGLFQTAMSKNKGNPEAAAKQIRKALDAMGLKTERTARSDPSGAGFRSGRSALDFMSPLPPAESK